MEDGGRENEEEKERKRRSSGKRERRRGKRGATTDKDRFKKETKRAKEERSREGWKDTAREGGTEK